MKWIRWWGLGVFIALIILSTSVWYLLAPWLVKNTIQTIGSETVGAEVNVAAVDLGLFPAKFNLKSLQVTNPDAPMSNLFEVGEISLAVATSPLLWKKIIVEEMTISGVKLATPRKTSGELVAGRKIEQAVNAIDNFDFPSVAEIDTEKLIQQADLITPKRIQEFNSSKDEIEKYWKQALNNEKNQQQLASIKQQFNRLKQRAKDNKFNILKDRKKWKALKAEINQQRKQYSDLKHRLHADKNKLSKQIKLIKQGPADDLKQLMSQVGIGDGGLQNLSEKFLGPKITPWVLKAIQLAKNYQSTPATENPQQAPQGLGRRVYFKDQQGLPEVLIKNISISGAQQDWTISGDGNDIAVPPWLWNKPAQLSGKFNGKGSAKFKILSNWISEDNMNTHISASAKDLALSNIPLKQDQNGVYELKSAVINSSLNGILTLETVDLNFSVALLSPKLLFPKNLTGWKKQLLESINQQASIQLKVKVSGDLLAPKIKIESGLEKLFQQILKTRIAQEAEKIKTSLKSSLSNKLGELSSFQNMDFSVFQNQLNLGDAQLSDLLGKL